MQTYPTPYALIIPGQVIYYDIQPDKNSDWWGWYRRYLKTEKWRDKAAKCKLDAKYQCERCGATGPILQAHHDTYEHVGDEQPGDLICLCVDCHEKAHQTQP